MDSMANKIRPEIGWTRSTRSPSTSLMDPVSSEMLTRREPVRVQGNITVGPVSLDTAQRAMCDQNHEGSWRIERDGSPYRTSLHV